MILLLDMDGPLADFDRHFYEKCTLLGYTFDVPGIEHQKHRFFTEHMVDKAERAAARKMVDSAGWFEQLPVTPGAIEGVRQLLDAGVGVWVCTKPLEVNPTCRDAKAAWLREHFPELEHKLIVAPDKSLVAGDILLDDAPHLGQVERASWRPIVFTAPYNGEGSEWADLVHWHWSDGVDRLLSMMRHPSMRQVTGIPPLPPLLAWSEHPSNPRPTTDWPAFAKDYLDPDRAARDDRYEATILGYSNITPEGVARTGTHAEAHEAFLKEYRANLDAVAEDVKADYVAETDRLLYGEGPTSQLAGALVGLKALIHDHERVTSPEPAPGKDGEHRVVDPATGGEKGQKDARTDLLPTDALLAVSKHFGAGAAKYADRNWERGYAWSLSYAALLRHLWAYWGGEDHDPELGTLHTQAVAFHALVLLSFQLRGDGTDDRPAH